GRQRASLQVRHPRLKLSFWTGASTPSSRRNPKLRPLQTRSYLRVSKQGTGVDLRYWPFSCSFAGRFGRLAGGTLYTNSGRIYTMRPDLLRDRLVDPRDETVHSIDDQHGDWRIENQIEDHARLHS